MNLESPLFRPAALAAAALLSILAAVPASAACDRSGCGFASCATPATPVPEARWGELQPADAAFSLCTPSGPVSCRDSTAFNEVTTQYRVFPWFMGVAAENGFVFAGLAHGVEILDARAHPGNPTFLGRLGFTSFPVWTNNPEIKWPLQDVATAPGSDNLAVLAGEGGVGLAVVDAGDKASPRIAYQSFMKDGEEVYAANLGGRQVAFLAASTGSPAGGLFAYDLGLALASGGCSEPTPSADSPASCPGVYLGKIGPRTSVLYVGGTGRWVVDSSGTARGLEIWDVQNPAAPALKLAALGDRSVYGVAMWQAAGKVYLATRAEYYDAGLGRSINQALIYDVSCVAATCAGLPAPLAALELGNGGTPNFFVTFSQSGATPFLYFGSDDRCQGGGQREWLFDVSSPAAPRDVTPTGYWDWYYRGNPTGFNDVMPRRGKFVGDFFYRAALSILDIHQWNPSGTASPYIFVSGDNAGEAGQLLSFSATAGRCTPNPSGWSWSAPGGTIAGSAVGSSIAVSWPTPGLYTVTASNSACGGAQNGRSVTVTASGPVSASFTISPQNPLPGALVTFDASASSGGPTSYAWTFGDGGGGSGRVATHVYAAAGEYAVHLTASKPGCAGGLCSSTSTKGLIVGSGAPPPPNADFTTSAPCVNQFGFDTCQAAPAATVHFTASFAAAGTTYLWEFGDGATASGKTATHAWSQGQYSVRLTVTLGQQTALSTKRFEIGGTGGTLCIADDSRLCLAGGRFAVTVTWKTPQGMGAGHAVPLTADTGTFWFFSAANLELVVKVIDACGPFGRYWVFAGGLTNVQVTVTVTDTQTGAQKSYTSAQGVPYRPLQDTAAFSTCP